MIVDGFGKLLQVAASTPSASIVVLSNEYAGAPLDIAAAGLPPT